MRDAHNLSRLHDVGVEIFLVVGTCSWDEDMQEERQGQNRWEREGRSGCEEGRKADICW
jgi:hypothetical protein